MAAIQARPRSEHPVVRIHAAVREGLAAIYAADREALLVRVRLALSTPALRARLWENQFATRELFEGALEEGVAADGVAELPDLIDEAVGVLAEAPRGRS
ncbi:hypothetical protein [Actinophytocola sp.]|uniref:hypothetical protein n=1 Tax=Actinophytocola sp. TaxID=1872138 RepID=UPI002D7FF6C9|nr:hypothetical protein [Actinophytocola sp.]HET9138143.1 hypothetical protein [Actinophytocola sp.]